MAVTLARRAPASMEKFVIQGGSPLSGTIVPAGNKNAALPLLACALLTEEEVVLRNVPRIRDTEAMIDLLADLGTEVSWPDEHTVSLRAANIPSTRVNADIAERIRASFLAAGPLRQRPHAAPGRRRDRTPPAGSAPRRVQGARRPRRARGGRRDRGAGPR